VLLCVKTGGVLLCKSNKLLTLVEHQPSYSFNQLDALLRSCLQQRVVVDAKCNEVLMAQRVDGGDWATFSKAFRKSDVQVCRTSVQKVRCRTYLEKGLKYFRPIFGCF
jgi:hypothetical protein